MACDIYFDERSELLHSSCRHEEYLHAVSQIFVVKIIVRPLRCVKCLKIRFPRKKRRERERKKERTR